MMQYSPDRNHSAPGEVYLFGEFELNPSRCLLQKNGVELPLRRQCFQVLYYLVRHPGVLVSKQELMDAVWHDVIVTESSLTQCILTIRRTLDDDSKAVLRSIPRSGYLFDSPVTLKNISPPELPLTTSHQSTKRSYLPWSAAAIFLLALLVFAYARNTGPHTSATAQQLAATAPLPTSIAVLPFEDLSSSRDQEHLADAISGEVLNVLARNPNLVVIASGSTFSFKGTNKDIKSIAARLNVANVLEGNVRRDGNRLHVMARLVNPSTESAIWSQTYDVETNDTQLLRNRIANSVASALRVGQPENISVASVKPEAFRHYLMGKHFHGRRAPGDFELAIQQFRSAVEIDPGFANAWAGLAGSLWLNAEEQPSGFTAIREEYKNALDRALELDPYNPEANARIATYYWDVGQDQLSARYFERALEFGQNTPLVLSFAASDAFNSFNYEEALKIQRRAALLDPLSFIHQVNLALMLRLTGRLDEAIEVYKIAFDLNPEAAQEYRQDYLLSYFLKGRYDYAESMALQLPDGAVRDQSLAMINKALGKPNKSGEMIKRLSATSSVDSALRLAEYYAFAGDLDLSFQWLDQARSRQLGLVEDETIDPYFEVFFHSPFLQQLTQDDRWKSWQTYFESQMQKRIFATDTPQLVTSTQ